MIDHARSSQSTSVRPLALSAAEPRRHDLQRRFREIFHREFDYVWHTLQRLGVYERELEDLTHETFLRVYRDFERYDTTRPVRPWLFGFAFRVASDYRRLARHRLEVLGIEAEPHDTEPDALARVIDAEALELGRAALEAIPLDRRAVFILHELDGCPIPEVAETLGMPLGTARSRLRLAWRDFRAGLRRMRARQGERCQTPIR
jgi:RNA polymerase sigma-70 factor (ECF subfamily)